MGLWTAEHAKTLLPALAVMILLGILLRLALGKKSRKVRMIPIQILTVVLLLLEVGKQTISLSRGYDLYHLPFHFCSLFIFVMPVMAFYKGKHAQKVQAITAAICTSVFMLMMIYPSLIYSAWDIAHFFEEYMAMHTVVFHNIVVLLFILLLSLDLYIPQRKSEQKALIGFTLVFCVISASMAHLLSTNYNNFYQCNVPILETLRQTVAGSIGAAPAQVLYVLIVTVVDIGFVLMAYWTYRGIRRLIAGRATSTVSGS